MILRLIIAAVICSTTTGCIHHSTPTTQQPNKVVGRTMEAWVDQDGTFYPSDWETDFNSANKNRGAFSLLRMAQGDGPENERRRLRLAEAEKSTLATYRDFISDKKRVFILLHGFNNSQDKADQAYELIKTAIAFKRTDGVVEFYWDGLFAEGAMVGKIWFNAAGYSQLAGTRALRKLLNATHGKEIVFIAHSRGASVLLSALSDPPYREEFVTDTERPPSVLKVYGEPALKQNNNKISALILAPAIGPIDFRSPNYARPASMRHFDRQLVRVYHSVNPDDWVLKKGGLSKYYNNTELGLKATVAKQISDADSRFKYKEWTPMKRHGFPHYVKNSQFFQMLKDMDIDLESSAETSSIE
jgi:pimeloyl-ACP methyl ester carboxylesterase